MPTQIYETTLYKQSLKEKKKKKTICVEVCFSCGPVEHEGHQNRGELSKLVNEFSKQSLTNKFAYFLRFYLEGHVNVKRSLVRCSSFREAQIKAWARHSIPIVDGWEE